MFTTRKAVPDDIEGFKEVVMESVRGLCKEHYTPAELESLLAQYPGRELYERWIRERVLLVAEDDGKLVGFAQYFPENRCIEAVHVLPSHVNQHVGKTLLGVIEEIARNQGAEMITLGSSLNATGFYEKCGYVRKDAGTYECMDGVEVAVVNFEKRLGS